ncbi:olfactory receptor 52R1-like [Python bivittatus]|uniref:Olfactory receptor n=1 Tax=Python bivittatus TaxID=176946 RepID=A0A9F2WJK2_PYTBI|nr:olfactory receptor 52R1-like [Python bivittatus]
MVDKNHSNAHPSAFTLLGIPGLAAAHRWLSIPFSSIYMVSLLGNGMILWVVSSETALHTPMFLFLSMLAATDLLLASSVALQLLRILWFDAGEIGFDVCLAQMFSVHFFSAMESGTLMAMALDRYLAICWPLRYSSILTSSRVAKAGLLLVLRGVAIVGPCPLLVRRLSFCGSRVIAHSYCDHMAVVKLACASPTVDSVYGLVLILLIGGSDMLSIGMSYALILRTILRLPSQQAQLKAFSTCSAHICIILTFYIPGLVSLLMHRCRHSVPPSAHVLLSNLYMLLPPVLNPIVYGVRTKSIRDRLLQAYQWWDRWPFRRMAPEF